MQKYLLYIHMLMFAKRQKFKTKFIYIHNYNTKTLNAHVGAIFIIKIFENIF